MSTVVSAAMIAKKDLVACISSLGIIAGQHHFVDLWARDSLFAAFGAPAEMAKRTIETFLNYQRNDGLIPYRIFRRAGFMYPNFRSVQSGGLVPDGGLMTVIAAKALNDETFLQKHEDKLKKAVRWYQKKFDNNLISEWFQCEWADAVLKAGKILYTNILYWKATGEVEVKRKLNEAFWNGAFFADWVDWRRQDYFASHPNMLAIVFGLATRSQAESILHYAHNHCWNGWTLATNYPSYPWWRIPLQNHVFGMKDYHNGLIWLQPGILYAAALQTVGRKQEAKEILQKISRKIIEYHGVYEVYEKDGSPVKRFFYKSEQPFAWSAGLYLWASRIILGN